MMRKPYFATLTMIVVLAMLSFACTSPRHRAVLDSADSLMNAWPDSALTLLNALLPDTNQMRKGDLMRFHLLRTNAENKCDTVFRAEHAALMRRVCDYYDHKASPFWGDERGGQNTMHHLDSLGYTNVPQEVYMQTINEGRRIAEESIQ